PQGPLRGPHDVRGRRHGRCGTDRARRMRVPGAGATQRSSWSPSLVLALACVGAGLAACKSTARQPPRDGATDSASPTDSAPPTDTAPPPPPDGSPGEAPPPDGPPPDGPPPPPPSGGVLQHHNGVSRTGVYVDPLMTKTAAAAMHYDPAFAATPISGPVLAQP